MEKKEFIQVFSEIGVSALGKSGIAPEHEALNAASIIRYGLDALSEFGGVSDFSTIRLIQFICEKFDPKDKIGKEVHEFMNEVNILVIQSNRFVWDYGKISTAIENLENL